MDSGEQADALGAIHIDDVVAANRQGVAFDPAAHHVFGDLLHVQELSQHVFRAERCVEEIRYALGVSRNRKPHYTRLFHSCTLCFTNDGKSYEFAICANHKGSLSFCTYDMP